MDAFNGFEEFADAYCFAPYLLRGGSRADALAKLGGAPDALGGQQWNHRLWILALRLALLPFLNGPSRLAHVIHRVAKLRKHAGINRAGPHVVLDPHQLRTSLLQLEADAPERFAGNEKFYGDTQQVTVSITTGANNPSVGGFLRYEVFQLNLGAHRRVRLQFQEPTLCVYFGGAPALTYELTVLFLPGGFHRREEGKTPAAPSVA